MKDPHSIPLWRTHEDLLPGNVPSRVVLSSVGTRWRDVLVEQHDVPNCELADVTDKRHVVAIEMGDSTTWEPKKEGRFQRVFKPRGAISFFPSDQPFSARLKVERDLLANVLFLALPAFAQKTNPPDP